MEITLQVYSISGERTRKGRKFPYNMEGVISHTRLSDSFYEKWISVRTHVHPTEETTQKLLDYSTELNFPNKGVDIDIYSTYAIVKTVGTDPEEVEKNHREFCDMLTVNADLAFGQVVIKPRTNWIARLLSWLSKKLDPQTELVIQVQEN